MRAVKLRADGLSPHIAIQYAYPVSPGGPSWLDGWVTPRLEWYHQSDVIYVAPEVPQGTQPAYDLLNARLAYELFDGWFDGARRSW